MTDLKDIINTISTLKSLALPVCVAALLLMSGSPATGARLSGEEGVSPVGPEPEAPIKRPAPARPAAVKRPPQPTKEVEPERRVAQEEKTPKREAPGERYVTIDFDNVDIVLFIKFISELTGKNFVVDKAVRGKVTIISPTKISVKEAYKVFESVLEVHGFTTVPAGNIIKVVPAREARAKSVETRLREQSITPEDKVVTQLIPLEYANPDELKKLFAPLISKDSVMVSYLPTRMLIVTDVLSNIKRLLRIVAEIDVVGIGEEISVIPIKHAKASDLSKSLEIIFEQQVTRARKGTPVARTSRIVADDRTNSLIVLATEDDTLRIMRLIELLDKEIPRGEGDIRVYYLQNANAEDLVKVLMAIPTKQVKEPEKGKAPVISKEVQIVADKATNSLIITADKDDYYVLEEVIKKLDIVRRMVYIEALLMEVDVTKSFELGVEWQAAEPIGSHDGRTVAGFSASTVAPSIFPGVNTSTGTVSFPTGFSLGILGEGINIGGIIFPNIGAVVRAFQGDSDVRILQTPQILTTDNEEAEIQVAKNIPFLTRQETSEAGIDYSNYEFKDVGVTLNIVPQINQERFVRLKITQEVAQVVEEESLVGLPTTLKRVAKTTVIVKDKNTVVIGGLIDESMSQGTTTVPCLGNIPALGWLFRSISRSEGKTNLFIFLTPHIIENPEEAQKVYEEKREQIQRVKEGAIKLYQKPDRGVRDSSAK